MVRISLSASTRDAGCSAGASCFCSVRTTRRRHESSAGRLGLIQFEQGLGLPGAEARERQLEGAIEDLRREAEEKIGGKIPSLPKTSEIVQELDQRGLYWFYKVASQSVHTTTLALESRAQEVGETHFVVWPEGSPEVSLMVGLLSCEVFSSATAAAAALLGWDTVDVVESFREVVRKEVAAIRAEAMTNGLLLEYKDNGEESNQREAR
jgi:hypothetical protein